jgi:hypothetical protein
VCDQLGGLDQLIDKLELMRLARDHEPILAPERDNERNRLERAARIDAGIERCHAFEIARHGAMHLAVTNDHSARKMNVHEGVLRRDDPFAGHRDQARETHIRCADSKVQKQSIRDMNDTRMVMRALYHCGSMIVIATESKKEADKKKP